MIAWFKKWNKKRKIKDMLRQMPKHLRNRYKKKKNEKYTSKEIRETFNFWGYDTDFICYAYCAFLLEESFNKVHQEMGEECDYADMCENIKDLGFGNGVPDDGAVLIDTGFGFESMGVDDFNSGIDSGFDSGIDFDGGGFD